MSYRDPKDTGKYLDAGAAQAIKERDAIAQQNASAGSGLETNIKSLVQGGINLLSKKKKEMKDFNKALLKEESKLYEKVGGFDMGYDGYNEKAEGFFYGLIDQYTQIKNHIDNGTMKDVQLGKRDLANIKGLIDQYSTAIPKVLSTAQFITEAANTASKNGMGAPNTLSVTGAPPAQLAIIKKISSGGPAGEDIEIRHEGGAIILYDTRTRAELNIREFNKAITNKNNPYLKTVPDLNKGMTNAYEAFTKNHKGEMEDGTFITNQDVGEGEAPIPTMSMVQEEKLKLSLMGGKRWDYAANKASDYHTGGSYEPIIGSFGESIWEDMMPNGLTKGREYPSQPPLFGDAGYKKYYDEFYAPMLDYLATTTINNNAVDVQRQSQNMDAWAEKYGNDPNFMTYDEKYGRESGEDYEKKQDSFLGKAGISPEDQEIIDNAKPGETITVTINGVRETLIKN